MIATSPTYTHFSLRNAALTTVLLAFFLPACFHPCLSLSTLPLHYFVVSSPLSKILFFISPKCFLNLLTNRSFASFFATRTYNHRPSSHSPCLQLEDECLLLSMNAHSPINTNHPFPLKWNPSFWWSNIITLITVLSLL